MNRITKAEFDYIIKKAIDEGCVAINQHLIRLKEDELNLKDRLGITEDIPATIDGNVVYLYGVGVNEDGLYFFGVDEYNLDFAECKIDDITEQTYVISQFLSYLETI